MGSFNNNIVTERSQRPSFDGRTILRSYFMRDGQFVPMDTSAQVSSVTLFKMAQNTLPSSVLDPITGLVTDSAASLAIWRWALSGAGAGPAGGNLLEPEDYVPTDSSSCSSIYAVGNGQLAVVLNGIDTVSSILRDGTYVSSTSVLSGEPVGRYIDVWTVKLCAGCEWQTFINETEFFQNNAIVLTEPLLFSTSERLYNKKIEIGSIEKLKIGTEITIDNMNISDSIKNTLKGGLITSGAMQIMKHNDSVQNLPSWLTVYDFVDTAEEVEVTGDNTFLYLFDTEDLTQTQVVGTNFGSPIGTYSVQLKYNVLEETVMSPLMYFKVV